MEARSLSKRYGETKALTDLNLRVERGEVFCMLGANGAGKTTTVNLFLNFLEPTGGTASIAGIDVVAEPDRARTHLTYLPEQVSLYPELTGEENLRFLLSLGRHREVDPRSALLRAGLDERFHQQRVSGYSKGMRQKVGIALAIARSSEVLILDEPTSGLDPVAANEFGDLILELAAAGSAVFMVTHDIFRAKAVADRVGIMRRGRLLEVITASDVEADHIEARYLQHMRASDG